MSASLDAAIGVAARAWVLMKRDGLTLEAGLSALPQDDDQVRAAAQSLLYATVRCRHRVSHVLSKLVRRAPRPLVLGILEVALSLACEGRENAFTVVNEAVRAVKQAGELGSAGLVNAVLRGFLRARQAFEADFAADPVLRFEVPRWWYERVKTDRPADYEKILSSQARKPRLVLRVNARRITIEDYLETLERAGLPAFALGGRAVCLEKPVPVERIPGFAQGLCSVQDAASQLAADFLAVAPGARVLDACAAPGGKACALLEARDVELTAMDVEARRCAMIRENLDRLGLKARVVCADATDGQVLAGEPPFDAVMLDAPCSASGIVSRHPDIVHMHRPEDIDALARRQDALLEQLWKRLKPGGALLYSTCSVFAAEGPERTSAFLAGHADAASEALPGFDVPELALAPEDDEADARLPRIHDGFYYFLLRKKGIGHD